MPDNDRLHALDAVRAFALLAGIVLHATMSFFLPLPAVDSSQSVFLGLVFYVVHIFRMSAFYLIAGFFARMVLERRGTGAFVRDRAKRILVPMIGGWVVLAPLVIGVVIWGVTRSFPEGVPPEYAEQEAVFPLLHLWFLYYLALFYAAALALRWVATVGLDRSGRIGRLVDRVVAAVVGSYFAPVLFAVPLFAVLYYDADWAVWFGIPTPDRGLVPQWPAVIGFGTAFAVGWLVHRQIGLLGEWARRWQGHLALAIALTVAALSIVGITSDMSSPEAATTVPGGELMRALYAACYTTAIWCWTFACIGMALRFCSEASAWRRYLADASYWLYLAHLPLVMLLQVLVMNLPLHWSLKFPLIVGVAMGLLLWSYRAWVRHSWLGALLNGRRRPRPAGGAAGAAAPSV